MQLKNSVCNNGCLAKLLLNKWELKTSVPTKTLQTEYERKGDRDRRKENELERGLVTLSDDVVSYQVVLYTVFNIRYISMSQLSKCSMLYIK